MDLDYRMLILLLGNNFLRQSIYPSEQIVQVIIQILNLLLVLIFGALLIRMFRLECWAVVGIT